MNKLISFLVTILFFNFNYIAAIGLDKNTYINTKNITYDEDNNIIELGKDSFVNINNINILADRGIIDYNNNTFEIYGNFYLYQNETVLSGVNLTGLIDSSEFKASNVSYIYNNDLKIDSKNVERKNNEIIFKNSFLTPCEIDGFFKCPTWSLKAPKSIYYIDEDRFEHFDLFLQVADYKVFYTPYLSHYGNKAGRKRGFLYPTITYDFIGHNTSIQTPYYLPLSQSYDVLIKPNFSTDSNLVINKYSQDIYLNGMLSGGSFNINLYNEFIDGTNEPFNTLRIQSSQTISKNSKISLNLVSTNNLSKTRSNNLNSIPFDNMFVTLENYNFINKDDLFLAKISTITSYSDVNNSNVPIEIPSIKYINQINFNQKLSSFNEIKISYLERDESNISLPSANNKISINTKFFNNVIKKNIGIYNKAEVSINYNDVRFSNNKNLNYKKINSYGYFSSELKNLITNNSNGRIKFVTFTDIKDDDLTVNENSNSLTFNYQNLFSEKRLFGNDLIDKNNRIVYGLENNIKISKKVINFNIGQSYDFKLNTNYLNNINQTSRFSDISFETKINFNKFAFKFDSRNNYKTFSKKELNYALNIDGPINLGLIYNDTSKDAYSSRSNDSKSLEINASKKINEHFMMGISSNLDLKEDYNPFEQSVYFSFFDECSKFNISYTNTRFNDNFNTKPTETFRFEFHMDYLGFVGYEQSTNLIDNTITENYYSSGISDL